MTLTALQRIGGAILLSLIVACSSPSPSYKSYTLYRNSPFDLALRVHWATFDAHERDASYNLNNCLMAARILNANVTAIAAAANKERNTLAGFWCEAGTFKRNGAIPIRFHEAFPTDA